MVELKNITDIHPIDEENYAETMQTVIEPALAAIRKDGYMTFEGGRKLHYEYYLRPDAKGSIAISHGFTESAEKFREMDYYFLEAGYNVFAMDHRGHGFSSREVTDSRVAHVRHFSDYIGDYNAFVENVVKPHSGDLPLYLFSHSMGGAVAALYIQQYPDVFDKAILSSPMISPKTAGFPHWVTSVMAKAFILIGKRQNLVFTESDFNPDATYERSNDTSKARFDYYYDKRRNTPEYQTVGASYDWINESLKIIPIMLDPANCAKVKAKVLLLQPAIDDVVEMGPQEEFVSKIDGARLEKIPASKHEIYLSVNEGMEPYLQTIFSFLAE